MSHQVQNLNKKKEVIFLKTNKNLGAEKYNNLSGKFTYIDIKFTNIYQLINTTWGNHTVDYFSGIKRNEERTHART